MRASLLCRLALSLVALFATLACSRGSQSNLPRPTDAAQESRAPDGKGAAKDRTTDLATACPNGLKPLGIYVLYCGKVNLHRDYNSSTWVTDPDCTSGCDVNTVAYCQKFWPTVTTQVEIPVSPELKPFENRYCKPTTPAVGGPAFLCCAP